MVCGHGMGSLPRAMARMAVFFLLGIFPASRPLLAEPLATDSLIVGIDVGEGIFRLDLLAQNVGDIAPHADAVERHRDGIGAAGRQATAPSIKAETGFDPQAGHSEKLVILFGDAAVRAVLDLSYFYAAEAEKEGRRFHEQGVWQAYRQGRQVDRGSFISDSDDGHFRLSVLPRAPFDRLELSATPYISEDGVEIAPGLILTDSSDFLLRRIAYVAAPPP